MPIADADASPATLDQVLDHIRPAVRRQQPYLVGHPPDVDVKLNQNESPFDLPDALKEELLAEFRDISLNRYPTEQPDRLCQALAEHTDWPAEGILVGNGSNELTYTFGLCFIDPGTPVVLPRPMFSLYEKVVRLHDGDLTAVPPRPDLSFDAEGILEAVRREQPSLVVLTTPNNPTGLAMPLAEIEPIVAAAPGIVVVDEAYVEFNPESSARTLLPNHPNLMLLRTFSKAFGLAGLRLGYTMGHPEVVAEVFKARLPFMVDRFAEATALALLARPALLDARVAQMKNQCEHLTAALRALDGVEVLPSQANFVLFKTPVEPSEMMDRLAGSGVLVRNMGGYPELRGYLRVNAGTPDENKAFLAALKQALV
jgi:histidinol-phosphate aminotransferase